MRANVEHNHVLHEHAMIVSLETVPVPYIAVKDRVRLDALGYGDDGIVHVTHVPDAVALVAEVGLERPVDVGEVPYFLSRVAAAHLTADAVE